MKSKLKWTVGLMMTGAAHAKAEGVYTPLLNPVLAISGLSEGLSGGMGIIMTLAFIYAVFKMISGGLAISKGDTEAGKQAIVGGLVIAASGTIVKILFGLFGMAGAEVKPNFN